MTKLILERARNLLAPCLGLISGSTKAEIEILIGLAFWMARERGHEVELDEAICKAKRSFGLDEDCLLLLG